MTGDLGDDQLTAIVRDPDGDWLDAMSTDELLGLAPRLLELTEGPAAAGRPAEALAALSATVRAYRVLFDAYYLEAASMTAARQDVVVGYLQALSRQVKLLAAMGRYEEVKRVNEVIMTANEQVTRRAEAWSALAGQPVPAEPPVPPVQPVPAQATNRSPAVSRLGEKLSVADLEQLAPGWVERASVEDLPAVAERLVRLAEELERSGQLERALRAVTEALRARRRVVTLASDEVLLSSGGWRPLATLLGHRSRLLRATGRLGEVARVDEEVAQLHRRLDRATRGTGGSVLATPVPAPEPVTQDPVARDPVEPNPVPESVEPELVGPGPAAPGPASEPVESAEHLQALAVRMRASGDMISARSAQEQLVATREHADDVGAPELAAAVRDLASLYWELGDQPAARAAAERAVAIHEHSDQPAQPAAARDLTLLGSMLWQMAELPAARGALERALAVTEQVFGADHLEVARVLAYLGTVHHDLGDFAAARAAQERALSILERRLGPDHRETLFVVHSLGRALRALGDPAGARFAQQRARAGYERALAGYQQELDPGHPRITRTLRRLGQVRRELRDLPPAPAAAVSSPQAG